MSKSLPLRKCISCQQRLAKNELLRVVKTKDGEILIDKTGKANGRGAYICNSLQCFEKMIKTRALNRAFKTEVDYSIIESLKENIDELS